MKVNAIVFVGALLVAGLTARAQDNTNSSSTSIEGTPAEIPTGSVTTSYGPTGPNAFQMTLSSENYMMAADEKAYGSSHAPILSLNSVGLLYNLNKVWGLELRQYFEYASNRERLSGRDAQMHSDSSWEAAPLTLRVAAKPDWSLFGSKPVTFEARYYLPTDRVSRENKELGFLRTEGYAEWAFNPKWSWSLWVSPRVLFNSSENPNQEKGSDAEYYQTKVEPYLNYYVSDAQAYYIGYCLGQKFSQAQRGTWNPDLGNYGSPELGAYYTVGAFTINPALISDMNLDTAEGSFFTAESRAFAYETLSYNLNVIATF